MKMDDIVKLIEDKKYEGVVELLCSIDQTQLDTVLKNDKLRDIVLNVIPFIFEVRFCVCCYWLLLDCCSIIFILEESYYSCCV